MKKLKYLFLLILSLVMITSCIQGNPNEDDCKHENTTWIIDVEATCTSKGSKHEECLDCGKTLETEEIEANHDLVHHEGKTPTCTTPGYEKYDTCNNCDYTTYKVIDAPGHNYVNNICTRCGDEKKDKQDIKIEGNYIYFGEYPQTLKEESVTITLDTPDTNGYYLGSDGERYAKVEATPYSGETMYFNNKTKITKGTTHYFKVEPIKWQILEESNGTYKLVADLIIDNQIYYSSTNTRTIDGETIYPNNYEYSYIRKWLNEEFLYQAFTTELQQYINTTHVDNSVSSTGYESNPYICNDTYDKVYLLSASEMTNTDYGYNGKQNEIDQARQKQLTDYAKANGCYMSRSDLYYNTGYYWLRSPDSNCDHYVRNVDYGGDFYSNYCWVDGVGVSVVPGITISLNPECSKHIESDWIIDKDATCIIKGSKHIECTICGKTLKTEEIETHHDLVHHEGKTPTCTTPGYEEYDTCKNCDYSTYKEIDALGHNYVNNICTRCGDEKKVQQDIKIEGNYIYFGEYPQTLKLDSVTITSDTPDENGYYLGSDGERYAKVEATPYSNETMYFNNKLIINRGTTYYFKVEPIKWQILEESNGTYKLVTDLIIDNQKFNSTSSSQVIDGETIYSNNYEYSDIRKWLNEDFLNQAFNKALQSCINTTLVDNSVSSTGYSKNPYICNDTYDKVYLLSASEMTNTSYGYTSNVSRRKQVTDYAKAKGSFMYNVTSNSYYNNGYYWLRSPSNIDGNVRYVYDDGYFLSNNSSVRTDYLGVVASITITI